MCILWCVTATSGLIFEQMGGFGLFDKLIPHFAWEVYGFLSLYQLLYFLILVGRLCEA